MSVTVTCLCTTLTIIGLELHVLVNMKFQNAKEVIISQWNVVTVSFFHANYISKQIHLCISIPIIIRESNKIFLLQIITSSSDIDIHLTLFLSPNSSEGRAWANKILLARYIKPEKIDYDNVNMFKWQSHFWLKTNKMLLIYSNDDLDIKDSNSNTQEIESIVKSLLFLFGLCKSVSVRFRNNYSMMVFVAY